MKPIYLEPDEEITSVVDRIEKTDGSQLALVVPKNSTLFQSLVNLKLIAKQAKESDKTIVIISGNKVGQRLAKQVGLASYANLGITPQKEEPATKSEVKPTAEAKMEEETLPDGTKIHRYVPPTSGNEPPSEAETETKPEAEPVSQEVVQSPEPVVDPEQPHRSDLPPAKEEKVDELPLAPDSKPKIEDDSPAPAPTHQDQEDLPTIVSRSAPPPAGGGPFNWKTDVPWKSVISSAVLLLIAAIITVIFLPKANVKLTFPSKLISQTVSLTVKTMADDQPNTLAGNLLSVDKTVTTTVTATGKKDIGSKATGTISLKNCEDTNPHSINAQTKLSASSKNFLTNTAVTVPAGQFSGGGSVCSSPTVSVGISAEQSGDAYNLANANFTISGLPAHITGSGSTTGGLTKQVTILSQDDINKAYADLEKQAVDQATSDLKIKADKQTLLDGSLFQTISDKKIDQPVNSQVDKATATAKATVSALVFDANQAQSKIRTELEKQLATNEQLEIPPDKQPTLTFKSLSEDKSSMTIESAAQGYGVPKIDKKALMDSIARKSVTQAQQLIKDNYQAEAVDISITPGWWPKRLPLLANSINVDYGFNASQ